VTTAKRKFKRQRYLLINATGKLSSLRDRSPDGT
jgi:hypothetical protein